jgi:hypothetical protein
LHPAWQRADDDPAGVAIAKGVAGGELRTLIRPSWALGQVQLHALFTRRLLHVREVEAVVARGAALPTDAAEQIIRFTVEP